MRWISGLLIGLFSLPVWAQHKCNGADGKPVIQEEPCNSPSANRNRSRCFVDGEVVYVDGACSSVKSRAQREEEAKQADESARRVKMAAAKKLEASDQPNFSRRVAAAQDYVSRQLRDPSSARFDNVRVSWYSGSAVVCGVVSGKNGFGGYANPVRFFAEDQYVVIDGSKSASDFDARWTDRCSN